MDELQLKLRSEANVLCENLQKYLVSNFGKVKHPAYVWPDLVPRIFAKSENYDLMFRYGKCVDGTSCLQIARVGFSQQRQRHFSRLLRFLMDETRGFTVTTIGIESPNEASSSFAKKHGFHDVEGSKSEWVVKISDLDGHPLLGTKTLTHY